MHAGGMQIRALGIAVVGTLCSLIACSGGGGAANAPAAPAGPVVTLPPAPAPVAPGATVSLTAQVENAATPTLIWKVDGVPGGNGTVGTVSSTGLTGAYAAPLASGAHVITAELASDPERKASVTVTIQDTGQGAVVITPTTGRVSTLATLGFTATITGGISDQVQWSVDGVPGGNGTVGTVTGSGASAIYTAPPTPGDHVLTATRVTDPSRSASAMLTVQSGCAPAPTSATVVNVKDAPYGARGDGSTDDTAAIQRAIDAVGGTGGTVTIPAGTYRINPVAVGSGGNHALSLRSYMTLRMAPGAILKSLPTSQGTYALLMASGITQANVVGGTLEGDRAIHSGTTGEWGMGLSIVGSTFITAEGVTAKECWGDGFYVSGASAHITLCNVVADHNRRQGLSVTRVDTMLVRNSTFKNTTGALPEAGIDIEPNSGETVANLTIQDCVVQNNAGGGILAGPPVAFAGLSFLVNVVLDRNTIQGNGLNPVDGNIKDGVQISNCDGVVVSRNQISGNTGRGILLRNNATRTTLTGNTVTGTLGLPGQEYWSGGGIYLSSCPNSSVRDNTVTGNASFGILLVSADASVTIASNSVTANGRTP
jgi:parallel beta-helix repeat protein